MEEPFKKTYPAGRGIASLFARLGWGIFLIGVLLALVGLLRGATPGTGAPVEAVGLLARVAAMGLGIGVGVFGLFSVMMAVQTRAAMDTADMTREMLGLARNRATDPAKPAVASSAVTAEVPAAPAAPAPKRAEPRPAPAGAKTPEPILDDVPPMPTMLRPRPVTLNAPIKAEPTAPKPQSPARAEPSLSAGRKSETAEAPARKPHPIFSAKPPH